MKLRQFLNTCTNDIDRFCFYFDGEAWDDLEPDVECFSVTDIEQALVSLNRTVIAWFVDANFSLHIRLLK